ncbi:glycosyltransferase family 2 protein [Stutzerimonas urumqiensis]|uniref:glycosyltransferase family 2 protein n=1 Tax=Stutzerimonas urumqiensis TaxID=638269 RepID=UPI003DA66269
MNQIFAVVLSYKRKELLKQCLEAIAAQTRPCDAIIVVDNASNDGTEEMLLELGLPKLKVYVLSENTGASGGFNAGFRIAYQSGADFVWMMDDDVIPQPDALEKLLQADDKLAELGEPRSFLVSNAYTEAGTLTNVPSVDDRTNGIDYEYWPRLVEFGLVPVRRATFVSILVPRATLQRYGLPIAPMFMWGDDTEFTLRITEREPGYLVASSKVLHLRRISGTINIRRETNPARVPLHRHFVRNEVYVFRRFYKKRRLLGLMFSRMILLTRLLRDREFNKAKIVLIGLLESLRFTPSPESADAPLETLGVTARLLGERQIETVPPVAPVEIALPTPTQHLAGVP